MRNMYKIATDPFRLKKSDHDGKYYMFLKNKQHCDYPSGICLWTKDMLMKKWFDNEEALVDEYIEEAEQTYRDQLMLLRNHGIDIDNMSKFDIQIEISKIGREE